jgi:hypothetical protein
LKSLYVTNDGGQTWRTLNNGLNATNINSLAIDPTNRSILYAATSSGLYKSTSAGTNWSRLMPEVPSVDSIILDTRDPSQLYATYGLGSHLVRTTDGGTTWTVLDRNFPPPSFPSPSPQLGAFAIDPANSNVLWAIVNPNRFATVIKSLDSGDHWQMVYTFPPDIGSPTLAGTKLLIDPNNSSRLYACCIHDLTSGTGGLYRSDDGGKTWIQGAMGPMGGNAGILSPWMDPQNSSVLYGDWYYGLQRSGDAGMTWSAVALPPRALFKWLRARWPCARRFRNHLSDERPRLYRAQLGPWCDVDRDYRPLVPAGDHSGDRPLRLLHDLCGIRSFVQHGRRCA